MKVLIVLSVLVAIACANPQFRALRARASGLGGGPAPPLPSAAAANPAAAAPLQSNFGRNVQPQYQQAQFQPQYQPQPQFQPFQSQAAQPSNQYNPFYGFNRP